jgi:hypothetical protein
LFSQRSSLFWKNSRDAAKSELFEKSGKTEYENARCKGNAGTSARIDDAAKWRNRLEGISHKKSQKLQKE